MAEALFVVGDVIRKLRKERRWSIRKLAAESGVGRMTISDLERDQSNYQKETLEALAAVFGKTGTELEAMLTTTKPLQRRASDAELAPEWVAFTRRVMRLSRLAQGALQMSLLAFEEAGAATKASHQPDGEPELDPDQQTAP
jgi:transcriptional regulator with XRE-family HTH domain